MKKTMLTFSLILLSSATLAHPGHAPAGVAHDFTHALWIVEAVAVLATLMAVGGRWLQRRRQPASEALRAF